MNICKLIPCVLLSINSYIFSIAQLPKNINDGLQVGDLATAGIAADKLQQLDSAIIAKQFLNVTSILISRHGKLVYEKYYNGFNDFSQHDTRSVTKTITGMLIGIAIDKKFVASEKTNATKYFADKKPFQNPDKRKDKITIEDLLTMSSCLECDDDNQFSRGNEERMYLIEDYFKFALDLPVKGVAPFGTKAQDQLYGRSWNYCTAGVVLLGGILERATGMKVEMFAKKYLFDPLEISKPQWQFTPMGTPMTGGGLRIKSRDFIKLAQLYINKGKWNDKQLISAEWVNISTMPHANARDNVDYGYLWWLQKFGAENNAHAAFYMTGSGGSKIAVFPDLDLIAVITANWYGTGKAHAQSEKILSEFIIPAVK